MKEIYFAGGCFWGVEEYFSRIDGVKYTEVGYANSIENNPSYERVCSGITKATEAVYLRYDEKTIALEELLSNFWSIIDPTALNMQGADIGSQYRTGVYYVLDSDNEAILNSLNNEQKKYDKVIVTEVEKISNFYKAEEYHQNYLKKNPNGYCHIEFD